MFFWGEQKWFFHCIATKCWNVKYWAFLMRVFALKNNEVTQLLWIRPILLKCAEGLAFKVFKRHSLFSVSKHAHTCLFKMTFFELLPASFYRWFSMLHILLRINAVLICKQCGLGNSQSGKILRPLEKLHWVALENLSPVWFQRNEFEAEQKGHLK